MDERKFSEKLAQLSQNSGRDSLQVISNKFQPILDRIPTANTELLQLLNLAVNCLEENEIYCQICFFFWSLFKRGIIR